MRPLLRATDTTGFQRARAPLEHGVKATWMPETKSLYAAQGTWRGPLLTFCQIRMTNARGEPCVPG